MALRTRPPKGTGKGRRNRKESSRRWLRRQLGDPYVLKAREQGLRSRAAFKLRQIDDHHRLLAPGRRVVDLGAAPGGWSQIAARRVGGAGGVSVVALDLVPINPIPGVIGIVGDVADNDMVARILDVLGGRADVVLSDMAAPSTGHASTDRLRAIALCEQAVAMAESLLAANGKFLCKVARGGTDSGLLAAIKTRFRRVKHVKPPASRSESAEIYLLAIGYRATDSD